MWLLLPFFFPFRVKITWLIWWTLVAALTCTPICFRACTSNCREKTSKTNSVSLWATSLRNTLPSSPNKNSDSFKNPYRNISNQQHRFSSNSDRVRVSVCASQTVLGVQVLLRRNRHTGKSFLSSNPPAPPRVCGPSCASAWQPGWGRSPGRWCTGTETLRCECAGAWS